MPYYRRAKWARKPKPYLKPWYRKGGRLVRNTTPYHVKRWRAMQYLKFLMERKRMKRHNMLYLNRIIRSGRAGAA